MMDVMVKIDRLVQSIQWEIEPPAPQSNTLSFPVWQTNLALDFLVHVAIAVALMVAMRMGWQWWLARRRRMEPVHVFEEIALGAGLDAKDQKLLMTIARMEGLTSPITLMLSPATLDHHARQATAKMSKGQAESAQPELRRIARVLFDVAGETGQMTTGPSA
jgi:hypothetical protein